MKCDLWFPTPIWSTELKVNNEQIYNFCKTLQRKDPGRILSNQDGWQSNNLYPQDHVELKELFEEIFKATATALDGYKYKTENKRLECHNLWININDTKYAHNKIHIHSGSTMSGVYYVRCNENSGKICFTKDPKEEYIIETAGDIMEPTTLNHAVAKYSPMESHLLLFPSWVAHYVENSLTDHERISIAFNIGFQ